MVTFLPAKEFFNFNCEGPLVDILGNYTHGQTTFHHDKKKTHVNQNFLNFCFTNIFSFYAHNSSKYQENETHLEAFWQLLSFCEEDGGLLRGRHMKALELMHLWKIISFRLEDWLSFGILLNLWVFTFSPGEDFAAGWTENVVGCYPPQAKTKLHMSHWTM